MPTAISTSQYQIELRDKDGNLKTYLTPFVSKASWEWNRLGGCGRCSLTVNKGYRSILFDARDDIQIRVKDTSAILGENIANENMADITGWTDNDAVNGVSSGVNFGGNDCMKLDSGAAGAGTYARRYKDVGTFGNKTTFSFRAYFDKIGTAVNSDHFLLMINNNITTVYAIFDTNGVYIYDGSNFNLYGAGLVVQDVWQEWKLAVDWESKTLNLYLNDNLISANISCNWANVIGNGYVIFAQLGDTTSNCITYIDWFKAGDTQHTTSKLVYRGFLANITPTLKVNQDIQLDIRGYFDLLKKVVINDTGDTMVYTTSKISEIVDDIADTFITPNTLITKGTIEDGAYTTDLDSIDFLGTVEDALKTLSDIAGDIEYGVDEDLVFYWLLESSTIRKRFFVGDNISSLERRVNWDNLVNKIYLVGGDVAGVKYKTTGEDTDSQTVYYLAEEIINNSSITTSGVANQYMSAILSERSVPKYSIRAKIPNTDVRLEDTLPIGLVSFYDAIYDTQSIGDMIGDIIGETADGGSDITIGLAGDGGSDVTIGGSFTDQVDRISYELSDTPGRFNIEIQLGDTVLETSAKIKRLERELASLTQY